MISIVATIILNLKRRRPVSNARILKMNEIETIRELVIKEEIISDILLTGKIPEDWDQNYRPTGPEAIRTRMELGRRLREAKTNGYSNNEEIEEYCKRYGDWMDLCPYKTEDEH